METSCRRQASYGQVPLQPDAWHTLVRAPIWPAALCTHRFALFGLLLAWLKPLSVSIGNAAAAGLAGAS